MDVGHPLVPRPAPVPAPTWPRFSNDLAGATEELRGRAAAAQRALEVGTPVQRRLPTLNDELRKTLGALRDLAEAPGTNAALRGLTATVTTLNPQLRFFGPYITVCNYLELLLDLRRRALHRARPHRLGPARAAQQRRAARSDSLGSMGADEPANGEDVVEGTPQYLHGQPYGAAVDAGQRRLRGRPARLPRARTRASPDATSDRRRPAHAGPAGPDLHGPAARARGPDVHAPSPRPAADAEHCRSRSAREAQRARNAAARA